MSLHGLTYLPGSLRYLLVDCAAHTLNARTGINLFSSDIELLRWNDTMDDVVL